MSLRAIKKREIQQLTPTNSATKASLFRKSSKLKYSTHCHNNTSNSNTVGHLRSISTSVNELQKQYNLLGRLTRSNPEFGQPSDTLKRLAAAGLVRTKSEGDVNKLLSSHDCGNDNIRPGALLNAKSEVCLQTISSHNYNNSISEAQPTSKGGRDRKPHSSNMSGAHSHRDLTHSAYVSSGCNVDASRSPARRRMSEGNYRGVHSQRPSSMSASEITLSSVGGSSVPGAPVDPNIVLRVPIIGYEVMEERARFTVYKLRVENPRTNDCWLVLRRYTDFVRLNTKLKQLFPSITLILPRKKIFGDNFNAVFLDNRVQGLQLFVNSIMCKEELRKCKFVREFFCLDEPPSYSESMEECRAIFEAQEETIAHLKMQINAKNDLILSLQQKLRDEMIEKDQLKETIKMLTQNYAHSRTPNGSV